MRSGSSSVRLDKWLWYARFFKTRSLATKLLLSGKLRINGEVTSKPHRQAQIGQVLTFSQGIHVRVIRIDEIGKRRGPAAEAELLYTDLDPPQAQRTDKEARLQNSRFENRLTGSGRPTKKDRRQTKRLKDPCF
ncbi:MAG: RNA-binding protein S4 [Rhodospirillaceae bacterium]|nr:RNA-binding protein S4 [Rhodospirillaceae bacterium]